MFVNGFTILLMMISLFCGIVWGVHVERQNAAARYKQQLRFRQAAYDASCNVIQDEFNKEIERWKHLVEETMKNAYIVGRQDGELR